jgi:hypothetical protein
MMDVGVTKNEYSRERIPGWTDRIFHRRGKALKRISYGCEYGIMGSDHRPVVARYEKSVDEGAFSLTSENYIAVKSRNCQLI